MLLSGIPKLFIISFLFVSVCYSHRITHINKNCENANGGTVNYVEVTGCTIEPCQVHPGTKYSITINFTAKTRITSARNVLNALIPGLELPFPVTPADNCGHGLACPIQPGQTVAYNVTLSYSSPVSLKISSKWELQNADGTDILCFVIPLVVNRS